MFHKFFKKKNFCDRKITTKSIIIYFSKYFIFPTVHDRVQVTRVYRNGQKNGHITIVTAVTSLNDR